MVVNLNISGLVAQSWTWLQHGSLFCHSFQSFESFQTCTSKNVKNRRSFLTMKANFRFLNRYTNGLSSKENIYTLIQFSTFQRNLDF